MAKFVKSQHTDFNHLWWLSTKYSQSSMGKKFYVCKCVILYNSPSQEYAWNTNFSLHNCFDIFFRFIRQIISMQIWFEIIHILFSWMQQTTLFEWNLQLNSFCVLEWVVFNDKNLSSTILSLVKHTNQWIHSALFKL